MKHDAVCPVCGLRVPVLQSKVPLYEVHCIQGARICNGSRKRLVQVTAEDFRKRVHELAVTSAGQGYLMSALVDAVNAERNFLLRKDYSETRATQQK